MPTVQLKDVTNFIYKDFNLEIKDKELLVLLGPIGAGKTTLLNIIAGLAKYSGSILFDGKPIDELPTNKRGIGYLFQNLALFPHLDVISNISYGLRVQGTQKEEITPKIEKLMNSMNIAPLASRYPKDLSGGEKQRVALARVLALSPNILLLDEPFNSLDLKTVNYLRMEFHHLQRELGLTTVFVTHNQKEAEELADRVAVVFGGRLHQLDSPEKIFFEPATEEVADFIGKPNLFSCKESQYVGNGLCEVKVGKLKVVLPVEHGKKITRIAISPWDVYLSLDYPPGPDINRFSATVEEIIEEGANVEVVTDVAGTKMRAKLSRKIFTSLGIKKGSQVYLILKLRWLRGK
jgi:molybdopterin-binding protein